MDTRWQVQEAKQRFSELLRRVESEGAQYVTRHGRDLAVVVGIDEYRRLTGKGTGFKDHLLAMPKGDDLVIERSADEGRAVDLSGIR